MKNKLTLSIAFGAVVIALSTALSLIPFFKMPNGGSVTLLRMLPLIIYAYIFGVPKGLLVGAVYGLLDCLIDPNIVHPLQFILDYPLPFAMAGLGGIFRNSSFKNKILFGTIIATIARMIPHYFSGLIYFAEYTPIGFSSAAIYSLYYQLVTTGLDMLMVMVALFVLERNKAFMRYIDGIKARVQEASNIDEIKFWTQGLSKEPDPQTKEKDEDINI